MNPLTLMALSISVPPQRLKSVAKLELDVPHIIQLVTCDYAHYLPAFRNTRCLLPTAAQSQSRAQPKSNTSPPGSASVAIRPTTWAITSLKVLPCMAALVKLKITLGIPETLEYVRRGSEQHFLLPLWHLRLPSLRVFDVVVNWAPQTHETTGGNHEGKWSTAMEFDAVDEVPLDGPPFRLFRDLT